MRPSEAAELDLMMSARSHAPVCVRSLRAQWIMMRCMRRRTNTWQRSCGAFPHMLACPLRSSLRTIHQRAPLPARGALTHLCPRLRLRWQRSHLRPCSRELRTASPRALAAGTSRCSPRENSSSDLPGMTSATRGSSDEAEPPACPRRPHVSLCAKGSVSARRHAATHRAGGPRSSGGGACLHAFPHKPDSLRERGRAR